MKRADRQRWVILMGVGVMVGLAGCGSAAPSTAGSSSPTAVATIAPATPTATTAPTLAEPAPCSLVTAADAATLTGVPMTNVASSSNATKCTYNNGPSAAAVVVHVGMLQAGQTATAGVAALFQLYASGNPTTTVSGIGDAAGETTPGGAGSAIAVAKADIDFIIIIVPPASSTAMQQVAHLATGRVG